jgi:hypothetical protein
VAEFLGGQVKDKVWNIKISLLEGMKLFLEKLAKNMLSESANEKILAGIFSCLGDLKVKVPNLV